MTISLPSSTIGRDTRTSFIRNLGGGSLMEAFAYVSNEAVVFGLVLAVIAIGYGYGLRAVKRFPRPAMSRNVMLSSSPVAMVSLFLLTVGMMVVTNANVHLRYGLAKTTSYDLISRFPDTLTDIDGDNHGLLSARKAKHIGLIVLESARADMIGERVEGKDVAPVITAIANKGTTVACVGRTTSQRSALSKTAAFKTNRATPAIPPVY